MAFNWSVAIAHEAASTILREYAFEPEKQFPGQVRFRTLSRFERHIHLEPGDILALHIIYYINAAAIDVPIK